jgi:hypothetical protein
MTGTYRGAAVAAVVMMAALGASAAVAAEAPAQPVTLESFAGTWEGAAQTPDGDVSLRSVFAVAGGKLTGTIESAMGPIPVTTAAMQADVLVMTIDFQGAAGKLTCALRGSRLEGVWELGSNSGTFWLARPGAAAARGDSLAGSWAGEVQLAGQAVAFMLTLRESAGALAGEIGSSEGSVPLSKAAWADGTLQLEFTYVGGQPVAMSGKLDGGKLVGTIDFNKGEAAGTWTAAKK